MQHIRIDILFLKVHLVAFQQKIDLPEKSWLSLYSHDHMILKPGSLFAGLGGNLVRKTWIKLFLFTLENVQYMLVGNNIITFYSQWSYCSIIHSWHGYNSQHWREVRITGRGQLSRWSDTCWWINRTLQQPNPENFIYLKILLKKWSVYYR